MYMFLLVAFVKEYIWHKALLMRYSMRLELTLVSGLNDPWLVRRVYIGILCVSLCLGELLCVVLCGFKFTGSSFSFFFVYVYRCLCICVCVCVYI